MTAIAELRSLSIDERLRLVEELWNSIAEDQISLPDDPEVIAELRKRKARFDADPSAGVPWPEAKERIRSGRA
ncbi:MAG: addiction module protein [Verrucomicrobiia bacterium]